MSQELTKIVHVTFNMNIGGAEQVIYNLIENTDPRKYDVSILCLNNPVGPFGRQLKRKGYSLHTLNRKPGFDFPLINQIRGFIKNNNINILQCHQYTPYVYGVLGAVLTPSKVIFTEHGRFYPDVRKIKRVFINPVLNLMTNQVTAISGATRRALGEFENFPQRKIQVIYNGIEGSRFVGSHDKALKKSLSIPNSAYVLGTVARLDSIKNHPMMISGLIEIQKTNPDNYLVIVGDGPERENLESFASDLGISSRVIFTGSREDPHRFYKIMDIFLLTSFSEGTAMTLLEAMASGLPIIATDVGGNPEIVKDGETGFIVPSDDHEALAEKIKLLLENSKLREKMGRAGRRRFEEKFTARRMAEQYEAIYDKLVSSER